MHKLENKTSIISASVSRSAVSETVWLTTIRDRELIAQVVADKNRTLALSVRVEMRNDVPHAVAELLYGDMVFRAADNLRDWMLEAGADSEDVRRMEAATWAVMTGREDAREAQARDADNADVLPF